MHAMRAGGVGARGRRSGVAKTTLLLVGLLVLIGGLIWLALDRAIESVVSPAVPEDALSPVFRYVNGGRDGGGTGQPGAMVWLTSTSLEDCAQVRDGRNRDVKRRLKDLVSSANSSSGREEKDACAPFQLGEVPAGTRVEILGECGTMVKIRISSGRLRGQRGCIETDRLDDRQFPSESPSAAQDER